MINVQTIKDIYPAIEELIDHYARDEDLNISNILRHRMYEVSWTSQGELFEELHNVLTGFLEKKGDVLDSKIVHQINSILTLIKNNY